ncbi:dephospho-CoA kinase [Cellulomonas bogoriensis 69B4 = DSM 16987]|uniref:Dephospho-CoA kinase n=1 Tax=Cellulomonas bogoriensis 69B4 = DSM 16987 TaxID=1386082 RepID=A0A0A0C2P8_9CELL|nr:dephospho-CoA kinase [Cellulomonas bogoriensis 69B4 = DSM 16987]
MRVGLTGGIAAGKSVVSRRLQELGACVVDHDGLAREVVAPGTRGLRTVVAAFGPQVLTEDGQLDRAALAATVFADSAALERLNQIVHPRVRRAAEERESDAVAAGSDVVVHDIPLLVETGQAGHFDQLVVVDAPAELRVQRLVGERGMTEEAAWARVAAQVADDERREAADVLLDGSRSVEDLVAEVDALWSSWRD